MIIESTPIPGIRVITTESLVDHRGVFTRLFCEKELAPVLAGRKIVQINHTLTAMKGALRGLHFQYPPHAEMKIVRCLKGRVCDVALDLRADSPGFLTWYAQELTPVNNKSLVIPEGCAHGFQVLEENSELLYLHTAFYTKEAEGGIFYNDPRLSIKWPLPVTDISDRDQTHPLLNIEFKGIKV